jgi:hypothetical protein
LVLLLFIHIVRDAARGSSHGLINAYIQSKRLLMYNTTHAIQ